jgi:hypothetical protein
VRVQARQEAELGALALFAAGAAGEVAADDAELAPGGVEARLDVTALGVELSLVEADAITSLGALRLYRPTPE